MDSCQKMCLGPKFILHYDSQLSRPYNMTAIDVTSNSVKLLFSFNETNRDSRRQIQKLEVKTERLPIISVLNDTILH